MMHRSGWVTKEGQEVVLARRLRRSFFDSLLAAAAPAMFDPDRFENEDAWALAVRRSDIRLQWDPDHHPSGAKEDRRAVQIGLGGTSLRASGGRELVEVIDRSDVVEEQRTGMAVRGVSAIEIPRENVYLPDDPTIASKIGLSTPGET